MFQTKVVEKIRNTVVQGVPSEDRAVYEIMWENMVEPERPLMTI